MDEIELNGLLNRADAPPPRMGEGLAARVRRQDRRGRRMRAGVAGACVIVLAMTISVAVFRGRGRGTSLESHVAIAVQKAELERLSHEAGETRRVIDRLLENERRRALDDKMRRTGGRALAVTPAVESRERAAGALLVYADELRRHAGRAPAAGREYRRVMELFPDSPLAAVAQANLRTIER